MHAALELKQHCAAAEHRIKLKTETKYNALINFIQTAREVDLD